MFILVYICSFNKSIYCRRRSKKKKLYKSFSNTSKCLMCFLNSSQTLPRAIKEEFLSLLSKSRDLGNIYKENQNLFYLFYRPLLIE